MKKIIIPVVVLGIFHSLFYMFIPLSKVLTSLAEPLHAFCLSRSQSFNHQNSKEVFEAIVCGRALSTGTDSHHAFTALGLIHILVVSGGHYSALETFLKTLLGSKNLFIIFFLFLYSAMTLFQPPGGRAFFSLGLALFNSRFRLFIPQGKLEMFSGLLALCIFPQWISSLSFHLSWSLSLLICCIPHSKGSWLKLLWIQILAAVLIGSFGSLSFLSNLTLAPLFSFFLFPMGLLVLAPGSEWLGIHDLWKIIVEWTLVILFKFEAFSKVQNLPFTWHFEWISGASLLLMFFMLLLHPWRHFKSAS